MRLVAAVLVAVLIAGCSTETTTDYVPSSTDPTSSPPAGSPPGWTKDPCDLREPAFSGNAKVPDLFRRNGAASAEAFARRVVEATGDVLEGTTQGQPSEALKDPHHYRTEAGFIAVYWHLDPQSWRAVYSTTSTAPPPGDDVVGRNATAHAVLGALGVSVDGVQWVEGTGTLQARRDVGGAPMALVSVADQSMQAEQSEILRRTIDVNPAYETPDATLGVFEASRLAQEILDCHAETGTAFRINATYVQVFGVEGSLAYWFLVEPVVGWEGGGPCTYADAGRVHVALDMVTGTVLSVDLRCGP